MPAISKGLTSRITLRTSAEEEKIISQVQAYMAEHGVTLSANDTIRHLIRTALLPAPVTLELARAAVTRHTSTCETCVPEKPPACPMGIHVRDQFIRVKQATAILKGKKVKT